MFTPTILHVTVIANGFQLDSDTECHKSGCIVRWRTRCGLGVTARILLTLTPLPPGPQWKTRNTGYPLAHNVLLLSCGLLPFHHVQSECPTHTPHVHTHTACTHTYTRYSTHTHLPTHPHPHTRHTLFTHPHTHTRTRTFVTYPV